MIFSDFTVFNHGRKTERISPAKFIYRTLPDMPTTEVAIRSTTANDLYVIMNSVNPETKIGTFKVIVRPFVAWIWIGGLLLIFGALVSLAPTLKEIFAHAEISDRVGAQLSPAIIFLTVSALAFFVGHGHAFADSGSSSLHAGNVELHDPREKQIFSRLLCMCGDCQRLPLDSCVCSVAQETRQKIHERIVKGDSLPQIENDYREEYGPKAIAVPSDHGLDRALWAVPVFGILLAAGGLITLGKKWSNRNAQAESSAPPETPVASEYDQKLEDELKRLGDD